MNFYLYKLEATYNGELYTYFGSRKSKHLPELDPYMGSPCTSALKGRAPYNKGIKLGAYSEERKRKMGEGQKLKPRLTCPHCGKVGAMNGMNRYHFSNCKLTKVEKS